jgi:uncharacterized protein (DUF2252 family)
MAQTTMSARKEAGRAARKQASRASLGVWEPPNNRPDPISILEKQAESRIPDLVPIRYGRMAASEFAFLRGAPAIMAQDLSYSANTGLTAQLCGDAHISNFGLYAGADRDLVFDVNDFDETLPGPFEWDMKRLTASLAVAARQNGFSDSIARTAVLEASAAYRMKMAELTKVGELAVWYDKVNAQELMALATRKKARAGIEATITSAEKRTNLQALKKLTKIGPDGLPRIDFQPPLLVPIVGATRDMVAQVFTDYRATLSEERRVLLDRHSYVESALKVVGVGSVGTMCAIALMLGETLNAPLFLQIKEAQESVLSPYLKQSKFQHMGHRVVNGQRLMQASTDIFLGWSTGPMGRFFYVRQLRDMKGSFEVDAMSEKDLRGYGRICAYTLARAHARTGDRVAISAYLGSGEQFDYGMAEWAMAYADQTRDDHQRLLVAIKEGRVRAEEA